MKNILTVVALGVMLITTTACNAENQPPASNTVVTEAPKTNNTVVNEPQTQPKVEPVIRRTCIKVWDAKLQKEVEKCRVLTIHKKHEGTVVPK